MKLENNSMKLICFLILILLLEAVLLSECFAAQTNSVKLAWNPSISKYVSFYRIYAWTNNSDTNCFKTNSVESVEVPATQTNAELDILVPAFYTFAATTVATWPYISGTNTMQATNESGFSNFAYWDTPSPPNYLLTLQTTTNLTSNWINLTNATGGAIFFRLKISSAP